jgi:hypothetical protein
MPEVYRKFRDETWAFRGAAKLDPTRPPTLSKQRWVGRSREGLLVLKP